ncbi:MAG: YdcF family protein [Bacteroidota bacterium]
MLKDKLKYLVLFLSTTFIISGCAFFRPTPTILYKRALKNGPYDVIIVPGVPYHGTEWSTAMKGRVIWACHLIKKGLAKNIIFSGGAVYTPYVEAKIMALYAEALGIQKNKIFTETKAEHSTENIYNSYCMAKKLGFTKIAVASDPFQSNLLMGFTKRKFKQPIAHIPFLIDTLSTIDDVFPKITADSAMVQNFKSIVETQSKWYRFRGTRGKNIIFEEE